MVISSKLIPSERDIEVLYNTRQLAERVNDLALQIIKGYTKARVNEIYVVQILHGAQFFCTDIMRAINYQSSSRLRLQLDSMILSSYEGTESTGTIQTRLDLAQSVKDRHILLVEDIIDTGLTISTARRHVEQNGAASVKVCTLLDKYSRRQYPSQIDYCGYTINNIFVIGYGLDFEGHFRELPFIAKLKQNFIRRIEKHRIDGNIQSP